MSHERRGTTILVCFSILLCCRWHDLRIVGVTDAKEVLPPEAYVNRTMYPRLIDYDAPVERGGRGWGRPQLAMGIISDVQYADRDEEKRRHFRMSKDKLRQCVDEMNANRSHLDVVVHLGDIVDGEMEKNFPPLAPILKSLKYPLYHILGNHDFLGTVESKYDTVHKTLGMPSRYYSVDVGPGASYKLLILDGNEISFYATTAASPERKEAEETFFALKRRRAKNANKFNGAISKRQMNWMQNQLEAACAQGQRAVLLVHHPMRPRDEPTNLWNDLTVVPQLTQYACLVAVFNGHAHKLLYDFHVTQHRQLHFVTFGGMVQSPFTSFAFADFYKDVLHVHGLVFGREIDYVLNISSRAKADDVLTSMPRVMPRATAAGQRAGEGVVGDGVATLRPSAGGDAVEEPSAVTASSSVATPPRTRTKYRGGGSSPAVGGGPSSMDVSTMTGLVMGNSLGGVALAAWIVTIGLCAWRFCRRS